MTRSLEVRADNLSRIMFGEQKALYPHFVVTIIAALAGGATFPGQALLFSRILNVFNLEPDEAQSEANFS